MSRFFIALFVLGLAACSSSPTKEDSAKAVEQSAEAAPRPGTQAWSHGALKLPKGSPVVLAGKLDRLGQGASDLKSWLVSDPAMYGEDGEQIVAELEVYWSYFTTFFGGEPGDVRSWKRRGVDPDRTSYFGLFPLDEAGDAVLTDADSVVRETFGAAPNASLSEHLGEYQQLGPKAIPTGFNGALQRAVEGHSPLTGARFVVSVTEKMAFESFFLGILDALEFREAQLPEGTAGRVFTDNGDYPAVRITQDGQHAIIDVVISPINVSTAASESDEGGEAVAAVLRAAESFPPGRPAAPAPLDDPALSLSFDQLESSRLARIRGYQRTLLDARSLSADERDERVFEGVWQAERLADNWYRADSGFDGLIYSLDIAASETNRIAGLTMTFVGDKAREALPVSTPRVGLGVEERSFGVSLDFGPLFHEVWATWLGLDDPNDQLDLLAEGDSDPLVFGATMPRNLALIAANLATADDGGLSAPIAEFLTRELPKVARAEVAVTSPDLTGMASAPKFATLFVLHPGDENELRLTAQAARDFVIATTADMVGGQLDIEKLPDLEPGVGKVELDSIPVHHTEWIPGDEPRLLVMVGLSEDEAEAERAALAEGMPDQREEVVYFFARPPAFVELLSDENMQKVGPFNAPILAQRLGPVVGWIRPRTSDDAKAIQFRFELRRPPKL